jgi:hypothetical protein
MSAPVVPVLLITLNAAAAAEACWRGDSTRTVYWLAAAALNTVITFPLPRFPWIH